MKSEKHPAWKKSVQLPDGSWKDVVAGWEGSSEKGRYIKLRIDPAWLRNQLPASEFSYPPKTGFTPKVPEKQTSFTPETRVAQPHYETKDEMKQVVADKAIADDQPLIDVDDLPF